MTAETQGAAAAAADTSSIQEGVIPEAFIIAARRWASGSGSAEDAAAVAAVSLNVPLPRPYDAESLGFDLTTRLPPEDLLEMYNLAKNDARAASHAEAEALMRENILSSVTNNNNDNDNINSMGDFYRASGTGAAAGGCEFIRASLKTTDAVWKVEPDELFPAGGEVFVSQLKAHGITTQIDEETGQIIFSTPGQPLPIAKAMRTFFALATVTGDALPAGIVEPGMVRGSWKRRMAGSFCDVLKFIGKLAFKTNRYRLSGGRRRYNGIVRRRRQGMRSDKMR